MRLSEAKKLISQSTIVRKPEINTKMTERTKAPERFKLLVKNSNISDIVAEITKTVLNETSELRVVGRSVLSFSMALLYSI